MTKAERLAIANELCTRATAVWRSMSIEERNKLQGLRLNCFDRKIAAIVEAEMARECIPVVVTFVDEDETAEARRVLDSAPCPKRGRKVAQLEADDG